MSDQLSENELFVKINQKLAEGDEAGAQSLLEDFAEQAKAHVAVGMFSSGLSRDVVTLVRMTRDDSIKFINKTGGSTGVWKFKKILRAVLHVDIISLQDLLVENGFSLDNDFVEKECSLSSDGIYMDILKLLRNNPVFIDSLMRTEMGDYMEIGSWCK